MSVLAKVASETQSSNQPGHRHGILRCYAYQDRKGHYAAECVDLDILVKAKTLDIAKRNLKQAVEGYIETAICMGEEKSLVPRRSPLSHRLRYRFYALKSHLTRSNQLFEIPSDTTNLHHCHA